MTIIVYAVASRSGGALSVLKDFYEEVKLNKDKYPEIKWIFVLSDQDLEDTDNIKIVKIPWVTKSLFHRLVANLTVIKRIYADNNARAIVSLQNMRVFGLNKPTIVSLHNVLPLYNCNFEVLDTVKALIKQYFVNRAIIKSLKRAKAVLVPSRWIREELTTKFGINKSDIKICKTPISSNMYSGSQEELSEPVTFFYPAASYPYKNHRIIVEAVSLLEKQDIRDFKVLFTFTHDQGKHATYLWKIAQPYLDRIFFCGELPREKVLSLYNKAVLIFSSKIETDAMPLLESMQAGGKIIAISLPYSQEAIGTYSKQVMFKNDDVNTLASYMAEVIRTKKLPKNTITVDQAPNENIKSRVEVVVESLCDLEL